MFVSQLITVVAIWSGVVDATWDVFSPLQTLRGHRELVHVEELPPSEGEALKCAHRSDGLDHSHTVYRYMEGKIHGYPNQDVANSWDPNWGAWKWYDCTDLPKGYVMTTNIESLIEGESYRCKNDSDNTGDASLTYRFTGGELRLYPNNVVGNNWKPPNYKANRIGIDCRGIPFGPDMEYQLDLIPIGKAIRCFQDPIEGSYYRFTGVDRRPYPHNNVAQSWDPDWNNRLEIDCTHLPLGEPMSYNMDILEEGDSIKCFPESIADNSTKVYRFTEGELRWYPNNVIAKNWNPNWSQNMKLIWCANVPIGAPMRYQTNTIPEGASVKCRFDSDNSGDPHMFYRFVAGEIRWYPNPTIAKSWNPTWNQNVTHADCTYIPIGDDMAYHLNGIEVGSAIKCLNGTTDPTETFNLYRFTGEQIRHYQTRPIADSWDGVWREERKLIDCTELPLGDPMPYNMDIVQEGDSVRCKDNSDNAGENITKTYRYTEEGELRWYRNGRIARQWNIDWKLFIHQLDCSDMTIGEEMPPKECTASFWGDPHMVTFDGLRFDSQPFGEAIFLKETDSPLQIEGLLEPWYPERTRSPAVTTSVAYRGRAFDDPRIQISIAHNSDTATTMTVDNEPCMVDLYVNCVPQASLNYEEEGGITVRYDEGSKMISIQYDTFIAIMNIKMNKGKCFFSGDVTLLDCETAHNNMVGLFGTPNRNALDDWMNWDGETLPTPDVESDKFFKTAYDYTLKNWILQDEEESILCFEEGKGFGDYADETQEYDEEYEQEILKAMEDEKELQEVCGDDIGCLVDGTTIGVEGAEEYIEDGAEDRSLILDGNVEDPSSEPSSETDDFEEIEMEEFEDFNLCVEDL